MGGKAGDTILRSLAAVGTVGGSELLREKPFQPGRDRMDQGNVATALVPGLGVVKKLSPEMPSLPGPLNMGKIDTSVQDAANAVQTAEAEGRRQRASKRQSSVLSTFQGASQVGISPAILQPAAPRKSVLG